MAVTPIELDSRGSKALRERMPEAVYESGRSTVRVRLPEEPAAALPRGGHGCRGDPRSGNRAGAV